MSDRHNEDWLRAFVDYGSCGEAPLKTLFWTGISTVAGALRRRVWIDMPHYQWTPNFYVILVAPPGVIAKSTTASIGMNLLKEISGVKFGPDVVTWQALVEHMGTASELALDPSTGDYHPMSALTISSSEFGNLLDPTDKGMVDMLVNLWDGQKGVFTKITKSSGNDSIENPWLNIIACTTPGWISGSFPEYMVGGGFTSRCIFVYAERKRQLIAYPDEFISSDHQEKRTRLIHDLEVISMMIGQYELTEDARVWGRNWYEQHFVTKPEHLDNDRFGGYLARKQTHIHKLAIVLAASKSSHLEVNRDDLIFAEQLVSSLEKDMPQVFSKIGQTQITRGLSELVKIVLQKRRINQTMLYRILFRTMGQKEFQDALNSAVLAGYIKIERVGNENFLVALEALPESD